MTVSNEQIAQRLDRGDRRFRELEKQFREVSESTSVLPSIQEDMKAVQEDMKAVRELVEFIATAKSVGRFALWVAKVLKWAGGLAASAGMIWAFIKTLRGAW